MSSTTTIQVSNRLKKNLDAFKEHSRETYEEVIDRLVEIVKEDEESDLELSEETLAGIKESTEDLRKGRVYTSKQLRKELGL